MARFVALVESGTHLIFGANLGGYHDSEITLAKALAAKLRPGMLCLADRLFPSYGLWRQFARSGAHLLWRAKAKMPLRKIASLPDGSYLAHWLPEEGRKKGAKAIVVRVVEYKLKDASNAKSGEDIYRLLTTILDPTEASATELAKLYPQRWEIEITIKESKTILRKGKITLRSKMPALVKQEFWGMILAHYLVRKMMAQAAMDTGRDPDKLSYEGSIEIIKSTLAGPALSFSP